MVACSAATEGRGTAAFLWAPSGRSVLEVKGRSRRAESPSMDAWLPAIFGLLGAAVGALAAIWGAKRTAETAIEQVFHQHEFERERWRREQRQQAYLVFLEAVDALNAMLESLSVRVEQQRDIPNDEWLRMDEADQAVSRAADRIELTGSRRVAAAASELGIVFTNMCSALLPGEGRPAESRLISYRTHLDLKQPAYRAFRREAQVALGFEDPGE